MARQQGEPYRSSVSGEPRRVKRYYIAQFLPSSSGADVYPMRALHLAAVQIQRLARGVGLRRRFAAVSWASVRQKAADIGEDPAAACRRVGLGAARAPSLAATGPPPRYYSAGAARVGWGVAGERKKRSSRTPMLDKYHA